jgi:hypothetical protein
LAIGELAEEARLINEGFVFVVAGGNDVLDGCFEGHSVDVPQEAGRLCFDRGGAGSVEEKGKFPEPSVSRVDSLPDLAVNLDVHLPLVKDEEAAGVVALLHQVVGFFHLAKVELINKGLSDVGGQVAECEVRDQGV